MDRCLLEQYNKQVTSFDTELFHISRTIATIEDTKELTDEKLLISDITFSLGLKINKFISSAKEAPTTPVREGIRLSKSAVPTFDGDPLKWMNFWQQFEISVHN